MRNIGTFIAGCVGISLLAVGCASASGVQLTPSVPAITVAPPTEAPQHVDPPTAPYSVVPMPGMTIQVYAAPDGADIVDTVCGNALVGSADGNVMSMVATVSGATRAKLDVATGLAVGDRWRFHVPKPAAGQPGMITEIAALQSYDVAPSLDRCNDLSVLIQDEFVTRQIDPEAIAHPLVICSVTYYDSANIAVTTVDDITYLAAMDTGRNLLPGETVQFTSDDGKTVRATAVSPVVVEDCTSHV